MSGIEPKKLALIRVLHVLERYSDIDHPLTHDKMVQILNKEYGIEIERKAVGRNISLLVEAGYDIETTKKGSYLNSRTFDDSEIRLLIDGVLASGHVPKNHSKDLIDKLCSLSNKYFKKNVKHVYSVGEWEKTENTAVFLNVELISESIDKEKKVRFSYNKYGVDKKLHKSATHLVSPYQMILHNQRYYLMGYNEKWNHIQYYRLDRITDMEILDDHLTPIKTLKGYENGIDYKRFSRSMPYMFYDEPKTIEMLAQEWAIDYVIDWFGKDVYFEKRGEKYYARLTSSVNAMEYWAMQYLNGVEILSPKELRDRIKNNISNAINKYKD